MTYKIGINWLEILIVFAGIINLAVAYWTSNRGNKRGEQFLSLLMFACGMYAFCTLGVHLSSSLFLKSAFKLGSYLFGPYLGPLLLLFSLQFSGNISLTTRVPVLLILLIPTIISIAALTNPWHHALYHEFTLLPDSGILHSVKGWLYWLHQLVASLCVVSALTLLYHKRGTAGPGHKIHYTIAMTASGIPFFIYLLHLCGIFSPTVDPLSLAFAPVGLFLYVSLTEYRLLLEEPSVFRSVSNNSTEGIIVTNENNLILVLNQAARQMLNLKGNLIGNQLDSVLRPWPDLLQVIRSQAEIRQKPVFLHINSDNRLFSITVVPQLKNDVYKGGIMFFRDVTKFSEQEELLQDKQKELDLLFNQANFGVFFFINNTHPTGTKTYRIKGSAHFPSTNLNLIKANQTYLSQMEVGESDIQGLNFDTFLQSCGSHAVTAGVVEEIIHKGIFQLEFEWVDSEKQIRYFETDLLGLFDEKNNLRGIYGIQRDVSQRKLADLKIAASELQARLIAMENTFLLNNQSVYIVVLNTTGQCKFVNDYGVNQLGLGKEQPGVSLADITHDDSLSGLRQCLESCDKEPGGRFSGVLKTIYKHPAPEWIKWEFTKRQADNVMAPDYLCGGIDVSEQIQSLEQTKALLQLTRAQNERLSSFSYITSHNIRSHYSNIAGLIELIKFTDDETERWQHLTLLEKSAKSLGVTLEDLTALLSIQGDTVDNKRLINLNLEIEHCRDILIKDIREHQVALRNFVPSDYRIPAVMPYLQSILINLLSNAIKYRAPHRTLEIECRVKATAGYGVISVSDNGQGIDLDRYGGKLFGLYQTFHGNADARGFGLYLVEKQVSAMGGKITVRSAPDKGTTFEVALPADDSDRS
jgi:signal transduction histidine kinase